MIWQDAVLTFGGLVLAGLLVPVLRDEDAVVPRTTSIPTGSVLALIAATYVTLDLMFAAAASTASAGAWFSIAAWRGSDND